MYCNQFELKACREATQEAGLKEITKRVELRENGVNNAFSTVIQFFCITGIILCMHVFCNIGIHALYSYMQSLGMGRPDLPL